METRSGDYILSPAYDLTCSSIHSSGEPAKDESLYLRLLNGGLAAGLPRTTIASVCHVMFKSSHAVASLTRASFLDTALQDRYLVLFQENLAHLSRAFNGW